MLKKKCFLEYLQFKVFDKKTKSFKGIHFLSKTFKSLEVNNKRKAVKILQQNIIEAEIVLIVK